MTKIRRFRINMFSRFFFLPSALKICISPKTCNTAILFAGNYQATVNFSEFLKFSSLKASSQMSQNQLVEIANQIASMSKSMGISPNSPPKSRPRSQSASSKSSKNSKTMTQCEMKYHKFAFAVQINIRAHEYTSYRDYFLSLNTIPTIIQFEESSFISYSFTGILYFNQCPEYADLYIQHLAFVHNHVSSIPGSDFPIISYLLCHLRNSHIAIFFLLQRKQRSRLSPYLPPIANLIVLTSTFPHLNDQHISSFSQRKWRSRPSDNNFSFASMSTIAFIFICIVKESLAVHLSQHFLFLWCPFVQGGSPCHFLNCSTRISTSEVSQMVYIIHHKKKFISTNVIPSLMLRQVVAPTFSPSNLSDKISRHPSSPGSHNLEITTLLLQNLSHYYRARGAWP